MRDLGRAASACKSIEKRLMTRVRIMKVLTKKKKIKRVAYRLQI